MASIKGLEVPLLNVHCGHRTVDESVEVCSMVPPCPSCRTLPTLTLTNVSEAHHHFPLQEQARFIPSGTWARENRDMQQGSKATRRFVFTSHRLHPMQSTAAVSVWNYLNDRFGVILFALAVWRVVEFGFKSHAEVLLEQARGPLARGSHRNVIRLVLLQPGGASVGSSSWGALRLR